MILNLYYFFEPNSKFEPDYGDNYFVMSDSLENAEKAIVNSGEYKSRTTDINKMSVRVVGVNQVIYTETS